MSPNMVYVYDDRCINCDWTAGSRSCMRHMIAINEQSKPSDFNCDSFKPRKPEREIFAQGVCGTAEKILSDFPTGIKFIMKEEEMDEKDKELQELRRKVENLEERITAKDYTIEAMQGIIEDKSRSLIQTREDYLKLLNGINDLIKQLKGANTEV